MNAGVVEFDLRFCRAGLRWQSVTICAHDLCLRLCYKVIAGAADTTVAPGPQFPCMLIPRCLKTSPSLFILLFYSIAIRNWVSFAPPQLALKRAFLIILASGQSSSLRSTQTICFRAKFMYLFESACCCGTRSACNICNSC